VKKKALAAGDPASFEAEIGGCNTEKGGAQKLKALRAAAAQPRALVFSAQGANAWHWHGFYRLEVLETFAHPRLARVKYTRAAVADGDVAAMRAALERARAAAAAAPPPPPKKRAAEAPAAVPAKKAAKPEAEELWPNATAAQLDMPVGEGTRTVRDALQYGMDHHDPDDEDPRSREAIYAEEFMMGM